MYPSPGTPGMDGQPQEASRGEPPAARARTEASSRAWASLWTIVALGGLSQGLMNLLITDLSTLYFHNWTDPCIGAGQGSQECTSTMATVNGMGAIFGTISSILSVVCCPVAGALSDILGRKPVSIISGVFTVTNRLALLAVGCLHWQIYWLLGTFELISLVPISIPFMLWMTDCTTQEERPQTFGFFTALSALEGIVAPIVAGLGSMTFAIGFVFLTSLGALLLTIFVLPESKPAEKREQLPGTAVQRAAAGAAGEGGRLTAQLAHLGKLMAQPTLRRLLLLSLLATVLTQGTTVITYMYMKEKFGLNMQSFAPIAAISMASVLVSNVLLIGPLQRRLGLKGLVHFAFGAGIVAGVGIYFATSVSWLYPLGWISGMSSVANPSVITMMTYAIEKGGGEIGPALGAMQGIGMIGLVLGPLLFRIVFATEGSIHGGVWIVSILLQLLGIGLVRGTDLKDAALGETRPLAGRRQ